MFQIEAILSDILRGLQQKFIMKLISVVCGSLLVILATSSFMFGGTSTDDLLQGYLPDLKVAAIDDPYFQLFNKVHQYGKAHQPLPSRFTFVAKYPSAAYTNIDGEYILDLEKIVNGYPVYVNNADSKFIGRDKSGEFAVAELSQLATFLASTAPVSLNGIHHGSSTTIQKSQWKHYTVFNPSYCPLVIRAFRLRLTPGKANAGNSDGIYTLDPTKKINTIPVYVNKAKMRFIAVDTGYGTWTIVSTQFLAATVALSATAHHQFSGFDRNANGFVPIEQTTWANYGVIPIYDCL